jgi:RNA polymerase sigma factor (sigma-70 family)
MCNLEWAVAIDETQAVKDYEWLIREVVNRRISWLKASHLEVEDVKQELRLTIVRCARSFDDSQAPRFKAFASTALIRRLARLTKHQFSDVSTYAEEYIVPTQTAGGERLSNPIFVNETEAADARLVEESALAQLDPRTREVVCKMRDGYKVAELSRTIGVGERQIFKIRKDGLKKIRDFMEGNIESGK